MFVISYVASTTPVFLVFFACRPFLSFVILGSHLALLRFVCLFSYVHSSCCLFFLFLFWLLMLFFYTHARTLLLLQQLFAIFLEPVVLLVLAVSLFSPLLSSAVLCYPLHTALTHHSSPKTHTSGSTRWRCLQYRVRLTFNRKSMPNAHTSLLSRTLCIYTSFLLCTLRYIYVYIYEKINKKNNHNTALRIISSPVVCRKKLCLLLQCKV